MLHPQTPEEAEAVTAFVQEGTGLISENLNFNIGGDCEFTFSAEGWPDLFILYPYIVSRMPQSLKGKWKFYPFNQGEDRSFGFRMFGADIDTARIMALPVREGGQGFTVSYYEENLCALPKEESDEAMWVMLENTLGEGVAANYVQDVERVGAPVPGMVPLPGLKKRIREAVEDSGQEYHENPKDLYSAYRFEPRDIDAPRFDVIVGSTCLYGIIADYYDDSTVIFDHAADFGAAAVYLTYRNGDGLEGGAIVGERHGIEDRISKEILEPMNLGQLIGGATGTERSYIDLIVFDLHSFVEKVRPLLMQYPSYSFSMSEFRRNCRLMPLT